MAMNEEKETLLKMYELMLTSRTFDDTCLKMFHEGQIPGFIHLGHGQEAISVGSCLHLNRDDYLLYSHRGFGHCITKGIPMRNILAELFGKSTGSSRGKGGEAHVAADLKIGVLGMSGTIGGCFPLSVGAGLGIKNIMKSEQVVMAFFGDGASNRGTFHSSLNMAALWKLPVVYVCENNGWAVTVPVTRSTSVNNISDRAKAYGIPGETVDGHDVVAVYEAVGKAVLRARKGQGPSLIEAKAYRWRPHSEGFPYHGAEADAEKGKAFCPLKLFEKKYVGSVIKKSEMEEVAVKVKANVEEAVEFAKNSPFPAPTDALNDLIAL